jgi:hypothetical protein
LSVQNSQVAVREFLKGMYKDGYFPDHVVDKGVAVLLALCERIEAENPAALEALYVLTNAATEEFNALQADFEAAGSEIETVARDEIVTDFGFIAVAYGFADADVEALVASRDW